MTLKSALAIKPAQQAFTPFPNTRSAELGQSCEGFVCSAAQYTVLGFVDMPTPLGRHLSEAKAPSNHWRVLLLPPPPEKSYSSYDGNFTSFIS
jgi:hypothetical protein